MDHRQLKYAAIGLIVIALVIGIGGLIVKNRQEPQIRSYRDTIEHTDQASERGENRTATIDVDVATSEQTLPFNKAEVLEDAVAINDEGFLVDENGEVILDEEGNPILASQAGVGMGDLPSATGTSTGGLASSGGNTSSSGTGSSTVSGLEGEAASTANSDLEGSEGGTDEVEDEEDLDGEGVVVAGNVLRGEEPVPNAVLSLSGPSGALSARTSESGHYGFSPSPPGDYTLMLVSPSSPSNRRRLILAEGQDLLSEDFIIPDLPPLEGEVVSASSGEPVPKAKVEVWGGDSLIGAVFADASGQFKLFPLDGGAYLAKGYADGYLPGERPFEVSFNDSQSGFLVLELPESAVVIGEVMDDTGIPVPNARVSLFGSAVYNDPFGALGVKVTDGAGQFRFALPEDASQGTFRVGAYRDGLVPAYSETYSAQQLPDLIQVMLSRGGSLNGRVVDSESEPIPFAVVSVENPYPNVGAIGQRMNLEPMSVDVQEDGFFQLDALEPGNVSVNFAAEGYTPSEEIFQVTNAQANNVGDIVLEGEDAKEGRIFGLIVDERGEPMVNHNVYIKGEEERYTTTDSRGGFVADELPDGEYVIMTNGSQLRGETFLTVDQTYPFARPGEDQVFLLYDLAQSVRFRVLDNGGEPVKNLKVAVRTEDFGATGHLGEREIFRMGYEERVQTSSGEVVVDNILAGIAKITIHVDNFGSEEIEGIDVPVGAEIDLGDITIDAGADLEGQVVNAIDGSAVGGMLVQALPPLGSPLSHPLNSLGIESTTSSGGDFRLSGLPEGGLDLVFRKSGFAMHRESGIQVAANQGNILPPVEVEPAAILRGQVTNADGAPLYNVIIAIQGQTTYSDRQGSYRIDTLSQGTGTIQATDQREGHRPYSAQVNLLAAQETVHDFQMQK